MGNIKKMLMVALAVAAASLGGCGASQSIGGVGGIAKAVEKPAIVAAEGAAAVRFSAVRAEVDRRAASTSPISQSEAEAVYRRVSGEMNVVAVARIAYDATIGQFGDAATRELVASARRTTDEAFAALVSALERAAAAVPTQGPSFNDLGTG
ncbi:MAG TPA: hypothetical protein VGB70_12675 [Allosphingosinicella sp.]|jgi:hypothetical protein